MSPFTRREFVKAGVAAGTMATVGALPLAAARRTATDVVTLGKSGTQVTRLAFGTGTDSGAVQAALGQQEFTRLVRYAYDRGVRFFETAEAYQTPAMLGEALKGLPRDSYHLMSKVTTFHEGIDPQAKFDELRRISQTEYFDIMLLHWQHTADWPQTTARWQEAILEAQSRKTIRTHGASVHGLPALRQMPGNKWLDVALIRINHNGTRMDGPTYEDTNHPDNVSEVVDHIQQVKKDGLGVIGMKLCGGGQFVHSHDDRV
jgi:predicted aldo/keto reductase-like oxidoreductase